MSSEERRYSMVVSTEDKSKPNGAACLGLGPCINFSFRGILARRSPSPLLLPKTLMGNAYRLGGHLADLAPAATLFTPSDAHVDRDGNDKPMHTVALDANRLCKHRPHSSCLWTVPLLFAIAVGPR